MSWSKRALIDEAFGELAMQGYEFDITPEEQQTALRRLDAMMATWEAKGVRVAYALSNTPDSSDLDADSGLPATAVEAVYLNLAIRIAAGFGKQISSDTRRAAREAYDTLLWAAAQPIKQQLPGTLPRGAGNRGAYHPQRPFFPTPDNSPLGISPGGDLSIFPE